MSRRFDAIVIGAGQACAVPSIKAARITQSSNTARFIADLFRIVSKARSGDHRSMVPDSTELRNLFGLSRPGQAASLEWWGRYYASTLMQT
jgi:hypothetical protein